VTARTRLDGLVSKGGTLRSAGISIAWGVAGRLRVGGIAWRPRSIPLCDGEAPARHGQICLRVPHPRRSAADGSAPRARAMGPL